MRLYLIVFPGMYIGGLALLRAKNEDAAMAAVRRRAVKNGCRERDCRFADMEVTEIDAVGPEGFLRFENGDY